MASSNVSFLSVVKEIEASYAGLPKGTRLRVERWVERLVTSGGNDVWLRHRNAYARLLLGQVLAKRLEEPFLTNPADGSLPPFPRHLVHYLRSIVGTHESAFWRDLYSRMDLDSSNFEPSATVAPRAAAAAAAAAPAAPVSIPNDLTGMKMLIREQMNRIAMLEQQLLQERQAHGAEVQELLGRLAATAVARPPVPPLAPSITSKKIIPKRQALKIYEMAKPAVLDETFEGTANSWWRRQDDDDGVLDTAQVSGGLSAIEVEFMSYLDKFLSSN